MVSANQRPKLGQEQGHRSPMQEAISKDSKGLGISNRCVARMIRGSTAVVVARRYSYCCMGQREGGVENNRIGRDKARRSHELMLTCILLLVT